MEMNQLIYFRAVANSGSVTKAAEDLFITQSALSRTIQRLETEVGGKLFVRDKGHFELNENGRLFLAHVQMALGELDRGVQEIARNERRTSIRIYSFLFPGLLENLCEQMQAEYPDLSIELKNSAGQDGMAYFESLSPEIVVSPVGEYRNYQISSACTESWCILYHQQHTFLEDAPKDGISVQKVVREPIVFFGSKYDKAFVHTTLNASVFQASPLYEPDLITFRRIILQGKYIAAVPQWFGFRLLDRREQLPLVLCRLTDSAFLRPIHICCRNGFPKNDIEHSILEKLEAYIIEILA